MMHSIYIIPYYISDAQRVFQDVTDIFQISFFLDQLLRLYSDDTAAIVRFLWRKLELMKILS